MEAAAAASPQAGGEGVPPPAAAAASAAAAEPEPEPEPAAEASAGSSGGGSNSNENERLFRAAESGDLAGVRAALAAGADAGCALAEGASPLMAAAEGGHAAVVAELLQAGAPWNQQDDTGHTAGEYAGRHPEVAEMLLEWGVQAELLLGAAERAEGGGAGACTSGGPAAANAGYLEQKLIYTADGDKLLDADGEAVMMGWEAPLMERHAAAICGGGGGHYLNVGFGLGIIDGLIQRHNPASHTIVEAHPDVHARMLELGWGERPGVRVLFGRWQDVLPQLGTYDGVFFDTYGEYYDELRLFHQQLPRLLRAPGGTYSFFNGLASDNIFFHMVYGRVAQVELAALGLATRFERIAVAELGDAVWQGVRSKYWRFPVYFLPISTWAPGESSDA